MVLLLLCVEQCRLTHATCRDVPPAEDHVRAETLLLAYVMEPLESVKRAKPSTQAGGTGGAKADGVASEGSHGAEQGVGGDAGAADSEAPAVRADTQDGPAAVPVAEGSTDAAQDDEGVTQEAGKEQQDGEEEEHHRCRLTIISQLDPGVGQPLHALVACGMWSYFVAVSRVQASVSRFAFSTIADYQSKLRVEHAQNYFEVQPWLRWCCCCCCVWLGEIPYICVRVCLLGCAGGGGRGGSEPACSRRRAS